MTATWTETVTVTTGHITSGWANDCRKCPIALALHEMHPELDGQLDVIDDRAIAAYGAEDTYLEGLLPETAQEFISQFDEGMRAEPITFQITWRELPA